MASTSKRNSSDKHTDKHNRRKCINALEKLTKNMFRLFRNEETTHDQLVQRFAILKRKVDQFATTYLDSEYHRAMREYVTTLSHALAAGYSINEIRGPNLTQLNRIQKIKNSTNYVRNQYKKTIH